MPRVITPCGGCSVPAGGTTGQVLTKASDANCDTDWETPSGGGGGGQQYLSGNGVSIAAGATDFLTWDNDAGPDLLVDPSGVNLSAPPFQAAGTYATHVVVQGLGLNATAGFAMFLDYSALAGSFLIDQNVNASPSNLNPRGALVLTGKVGPAVFLGTVNVRVTNNDSVARFFALGSAFIQQIP